MIFDTVINNATIIDGTGRRRYRADLGLSGGKIAAIARGEKLNGPQALEADGLAAAPGFILEEAVRRMTSLPAERIGLNEVGRIAEGRPADLVLFDPLTVADNTTWEHADAPPSGVRAVLVSGQVVAADGQLLPVARQGRVLRR